MGLRLKSVLASLLILVLFVASSQAAVCEVACDLGAQSIGCHPLEGAAASTVGMANMSHSHCLHSERETGDALPAQARQHSSTHLARVHSAVCHHGVAPVVESSRPVKLDQATILWCVFEVMPIRMNSAGRTLSANSSPHRILPAADSPLTSLRI